MGLSALWRYPIKSMQGESLRQTTLDGWGIPGDRIYGLIDRQTGRIVSAKQPKRYPGVLSCRAELVGPGAYGAPASPRVTLPDGETIDATDIEPRLSALTGRSLRLAATRGAGATAERLDVDDLSAEETSQLLDSRGEPPEHLTGEFELGGAARPGSFFDFGPLHLVATSTLSRLSALHREGSWHPRRFRPNLIVDDGHAGGRFGEDAWLGNDLLIGDHVRLRVVVPTPRCVVVNLAQPALGAEPELGRDPGLLRVIGRHHRIEASGLGPGPCVGAYAEVIQAGRVAIGDAVQLVAPEGPSPGAIAKALARR